MFGQLANIDEERWASSVTRNYPTPGSTYGTYGDSSGKLTASAMLVNSVAETAAAAA
jgi:hypothetical protein